MVHAGLEVGWLGLARLVYSGFSERALAWARVPCAALPLVWPWNGIIWAGPGLGLFWDRQALDSDLLVWPELGCTGPGLV